MNLDQIIIILIQVLLYMDSIETTICLYNFYNLCFPLLSYALLLSTTSYFYLTMKIMIQYNTYEGDFSSFPSYNSKPSYQIKDYNYFTLITLNSYNRKMRENAQDLCYNLETIKAKISFLDISLMFHPFKFKTSSKCVLVHIELSSTCACLLCSCITWFMDDVAYMYWYNFRSTS
jgi:hypothetical protein